MDTIPCTNISQTAGQQGSNSSTLTHFVVSVAVEAFSCEALHSLLCESQQLEREQESAGRHTLARYCMAEVELGQGQGQEQEQGLHSVETLGDKGFQSCLHTALCHQEMRPL